MDGIEFIAEVGINHDGSIDKAFEYVERLKNTSVDTIKFQLFNVSELCAETAQLAGYQRGFSDGSQIKMLRKFALEYEILYELKKKVEDSEKNFLVSPFDLSSLSFCINELGLNRVKIASGEITNFQLLKIAAQNGVKMIISTGASSLDDISNTMDFIKSNWISSISFESAVSILHCTSQYPAPLEELNLEVIERLKKLYGVAVGYSDHSLGALAPLVAVAKGATIIEKHVTIDPESTSGPDHKASLAIADIEHLTDLIQKVQSAIGDGKKRVMFSELANQEIVRKSIFATRSIQKGEIFSEKNITAKRPLTSGICASKFYDLIGKRAVRHYEADQQLSVRELK